MLPSVTAEKAKLSDGMPAVSVKLQGESAELNVWLTLSEVEQLREIISETDAVDPIALGTSANAAAHWVLESSAFSVLVGPNDECWDVCVTFPRSLLDDLAAELDALTEEPS